MTFVRALFVVLLGGWSFVAAGGGDGIDLRLSTNLESVSRGQDGRIVAHVSGDDGESTIKSVERTLRANALAIQAEILGERTADQHFRTNRGQAAHALGIPSNATIPLYVKNEFSDFYRSMFDQQAKHAEVA